MLLNPYRFGSFTVSNRLVFPLTYDEMDSANAVSLTRLGATAPLVTPEGFEGDGYGTRLLYNSLPAWVAEDLPLTIHGTVVARQAYVNSDSADQMLFGLTTNTTNWWAYQAFCQGYTTGFVSANTIKFYITDTGSTRRIPLGRTSWAYSGIEPELTVSGNDVLPQGIVFLDSDTLLLGCHAEDTESIVYKIRLSDWTLLGQFTFGTTTYRHIASLAKRDNGDIWCADYETGKLLRLDVSASISSGSAVILQTIDSSSLTGTGAIAFATISSTEYLLLAQYNTADASGYLNLFPATTLSGSTLVESDRYKRFVIGRRVQGIAMRSGSLLVSRNTIYGSTNAYGFVETYDITGMASLSDGATVNASTNPTYLLSTMHAPGPYPEDIAVHPVTNRVFIPTEGHGVVADIQGWLGVWNGSMNQYAEETYHLTANYDGASTTVIKVNNTVFHTLTGSNPLYGPSILCIGGRPSAVAAGFGNGCSVSRVRNVLLQDQALSNADYSAAISGSYEADALTAYTLTLTNAGAESGSATGWTAETGTGIAAKNTANRTPPEGSWYFDGGSNVVSVSRQRLDLVSQGMSSGELDSGTAWAKIRWYQAAFDNNDPGGMGIRTLNAALSTLATTYSPLVYTLGGTGAAPYYWQHRCYPVAIPTNTRHIDALYNASGRTSGTNNDHYVDDIRVTIYVP